MSAGPKDMFIPHGEMNRSVDTPLYPGVDTFALV